ncbi:hypothetical protein [Escherichia coli]|uniref:hypothetical protein n=1 Tax=Escherichia coli TaxID=562 RepID=UPI00203EBE4C|nr:hypothetical protein [Escherichia coli]
MKLTLRIAALTIVCMSLSQTALAASYSAEDQEQLTLECLLTNNKYASAFIAQDSAGYALGTQSAPTAELNLVTNQPGVNAYYNSQMIAGGSLYWIRVVGNDSNLLIVFYVQIMPDDFVMQLHRF